jgi:hypothetical protein
VSSSTNLGRAPHLGNGERAASRGDRARDQVIEDVGWWVVKTWPCAADVPTDWAPRVGGKRRTEAIRTIRVAARPSDIPMALKNEVGKYRCELPWLKMSAGLSSAWRGHPLEPWKHTDPTEFYKTCRASQPAASLFRDVHQMSEHLLKSSRANGSPGTIHCDQGYRMVPVFSGSSANAPIKITAR